MNYWAIVGTNLSGPPWVRITEGPLYTEKTLCVLRVVCRRGIGMFCKKIRSLEYQRLRWNKIALWRIDGPAGEDRRIIPTRELRRKIRWYGFEFSCSFQDFVTTIVDLRLHEVQWVFGPIHATVIFPINGSLVRFYMSGDTLTHNYWWTKIIRNRFSFIYCIRAPGQQDGFRKESGPPKWAHNVQRNEILNMFQ